MEEIVQEIKRLHAGNGACASQATTHLQRWQQSSACTWEIITQLIQYPDELVAFFGANTAVQKAQLGGGCNGEQLLQRIVSLNGAPNGAPIRRQLCTAYADLAIYGHASLHTGVQTLKDDALLDLLSAFPEEARNQKVLVPHDTRLQFIQTLLSNQREVFDVLATKNNPRKVLEAAELWLSLPCPSTFAAKEAGTKFTSDVFRKRIHEHPVIRLACENMLNANVESAVQLLSSLLQLTNEVNAQTVDAIRLAWEATANLAQQISPPLDPDAWNPYSQNYAEGEEMVRRMSYVSKLLSEWGTLFYRGLGKAKVDIPPKRDHFPDPMDGTPSMTDCDADVNVNGIGTEMVTGNGNGLDFDETLTQRLGRLEETPCGFESPEWHQRIGDVALHWMTIRHTDLARGGFDFWREVLATNNQDNKIYERELVPWLEKFMKKCVLACRFPVEPEKQQNFDVGEFVRLRDSCTNTITEVANILPTEWIIELIGNEIPNMMKWNDLDAGVFILTGVAPRARAGKDKVIPKMINLLPTFAYPSHGIPAILLRASAGRLVLYTAGYLAGERAELITTLQFVLTTLLPSLLDIPDADMDLRQYAEAICVDALKVVTYSAREQILGVVPPDLGGGEKFWPELVEQLLKLAKNSNFHIEVRIQLCFVLGQVISSLPDLALMEQTILNYVNQMEPSPNMASPGGGKTPAEMKLYLASLTSLCTIDQKTVMSDQITSQTHPIVRIWEHCWNNIQKYTVVAVRHDYEDWLLQLCASLQYAFGYCRHAITTSPFFAASLRMLGEAAEAKPHNCYYTFLRATMGIFAPVGDPALDNLLVESLGMYTVPVARQLESNFSPDVVANCYEMLGDSLRWSNLANGALRSQWLPLVFDPALTALETNHDLSTHEKALSAMLGFFCSFVRWSTEGPDIVQLSKPLWEGRIGRVVGICVDLLGRCSENPYTGTVCAVAEVIRPLLNGSMEFETKSCLKQSFQKLPEPLTKSLMEAHRAVDILCVEKCDARRFIKQLQDMVCEFHGQVKRSLASSA